MANGTPREAAFLVCLSEAYELAGRKVSDSTIMSAAKEMAARIPCGDTDIKELFVTAREYSDIPTIKTLWKAWDTIRDNRYIPNSSMISYDVEIKTSMMMAKINTQLAVKLLAYKVGTYKNYCEAYLMKKVGPGKYEYAKPELKRDFENDFMPFVMEVCGKRLGENPYLPDHPVQKYIRGEK